MMPLVLSHFTLTSCLGRGVEETRAALRDGTSGLKPCDFESAELETWIGEVDGVDAVTLPAHLARYVCRNSQLALLALCTDGLVEAAHAAIARYGARRIAVLIGTSSAGILQTELAYRRRDPVTARLPPDFQYSSTHNLFSSAALVRDYLGIEGPALTISTACSSSAKVFPAAARMIEAGIVDAALVGGVDALCLTTLYGFTSLELAARGPCRPYDRERAGISVAEGAAFALLERVPDTLDAGAVLFRGAGESGDAYHMSAPHPEGLGARLAMQGALASAGIDAQAVEYINLHGTATATNDIVEGRAVAALFGADVACSSTKGATGHTLGAAGAIEALICALALRDGLLPGSAHTRQLDPALTLDYLRTPRRTPITRALTNSFGFGGSNCSLLFSRAG